MSGYGAKKQWDDMEETVEGDFADMIDFLLSLLTQKDGDFVTVAGDTPARTRWRVARMASRWKGEIERLQAESQQVIDNCLRRARNKSGAAREVELQMAAKHVQYIKLLETAYREIRRLINTVWPLHGTTLIKRLRGEGRVKTASAIGQSGGAVVNEMLQKYMGGIKIPSISSVVSTTPQLPTSSGEKIVPTPTPETRKSKTVEEEPEDVDEEDLEELLDDGDSEMSLKDVEDEPEEEEEDVEEELSEEEIEEALSLDEE